MLIQPDSSNLGDFKLSAEEALIKLQEENASLLENRKIHGQAELEDAERSAGPRMSYQDLIRRICKANSQVKALDGSPGNIALYAPKTRLEMLEPYEPSEKGEFFDDHKYVGGFAKEPLPEFSHIIVDDRGMAKREVRGWRSVVITLIKAGIVTYRGAVKQFGEPTGPRGVRWFDQLQAWRNA